MLNRLDMRKIYDLEFQVIWDQSRKAFGIERAGVPTGRFTPDKASAVAIATQAALFENREGKTAAVYSFDSEQKRTIEWSA
jgi:hypothetical protein